MSTSGCFLMKASRSCPISDSFMDVYTISFDAAAANPAAAEHQNDGQNE